MVDAAQAWLRNQRAMRVRLWLDRTSVGRVLAQRVVNAILVVIAHVVADQTAKMLFIHRDDMVEDLAAAASDPSFGGSVLPRCLNARPFWLKSGGLQEANDIGVEDRVAIHRPIGSYSNYANLLPRRLRIATSFYGCGVTLKCRILRRPCSMTKKQYNTRNVAVGTVKRSRATIASRWL